MRTNRTPAAPKPPVHTRESAAASLPAMYKEPVSAWYTRMLAAK